MNENIISITIALAEGEIVSWTPIERTERDDL